MRSLRLRVVALAVLIALCAGAASALVATRTAERGLREQEDRRAVRAVERLRRQLDHLANDLLDDLAADSHRLAAASAGELSAWLRRGRSEAPEAIAVAVIGPDGIAVAGASPQPGLDAAALRSALVGLGGARACGLVAVGGCALVGAVQPLPGAGRRLAALGLAPAADLARFQDGDWRLTTFCRPGGGLAALAAPRFGDVAIARESDGLHVRSTLGILGGEIAVDLSSAAVEASAAVNAARRDHLVVGAAVAAIAAAIGAALAWHWTRPLAVLAAACRRRADDPATPIPAVRGVAEAELLADSLRALVAAERAGIAGLAQALERETTANAVHQRFLAQLGSEFGGPIRALTAAIERMQHSGRLDPGALAAAQAAAAQLEERFQDVLGLAAGLGDDEPTSTALEVDRYLAGIADLLRPQAERRGLTVQVEAPAARLLVDARLLTPILVNLAANALKATQRGGIVLAVAIERGASAWTVRDSGPGLPGELAARYADACRRGEVIPGTPGLGLGLALVLANARTLGGSVRLAANGADGATVVVRLPDAPGTTAWRRIVTARIARP